MTVAPEDIVRFSDAPPPPGASAWVGGRRPESGIRIVPADPAWPETYRAIESRIRAAVGDVALRIDHVGSTSVPGLPAKPVIDIDLIVPDPADESRYLPALEADGFALTVREPWWYEHRCLVAASPRVNLHVFGPDAAEPVRHRIFRDWLREHPADRDLYRDAKLAAAEKANAAGEHVMDYNARKQDVIRAIYRRAFEGRGLLPAV